MPRPDPNAPKAGQLGMELGVTEQTGERRAGEVLRGRHSKVIDNAISEAFDAGILTSVDGGVAAALRLGFWAGDSFETNNMPYGPAKLLPALTEALREAHMTPDSRQTDVDGEIAALLTDLATVDTEAPDHDDAALPHAED